MLLHTHTRYTHTRTNTHARTHTQNTHAHTTDIHTQSSTNCIMNCKLCRLFDYSINHNIYNTNIQYKPLILLTSNFGKTCIVHISDFSHSKRVGTVYRSEISRNDREMVRSSINPTSFKSMKSWMCELCTL